MWHCMLGMCWKWLVLLVLPNLSSTYKSIQTSFRIGFRWRFSIVKPRPYPHTLDHPTMQKIVNWFFSSLHMGLPWSLYPKDTSFEWSKLISCFFFICSFSLGFTRLKLMKVVVTCLLPKQVYEEWDEGVLWCNLDGSFDMLRLVCLL